MKKALMLIAIAAILPLFMAAGAQAASEPCKVPDGESGALLQCYQKDYQEKTQANDRRYKDLITRSKELLQQSLESEAKARSQSYVEFIRNVNHTMIDARRAAAMTCVRLAAKFQSQSTSAVAAVNCRTDHEVQLDNDLKRFELRLQLMSLQHPLN